MSCAEHQGPSAPSEREIQAAREIVARALAEDLGDRGDVTTDALIPPDVRATGRVVARQAGVVAGTIAATEAFRDLDVRWERHDGDRVEPDDVIGAVEGPLRAMLTAERTALNLLGRLSGIATLTARYVEAAGPGATILDTRKTTPGLRVLEKAAVRAGGGANHRMGLHDAVLVKDNHLAHVGVAEAVTRAREHAPGLLVEIECDTLEQVSEAVGAGADRVLLDNMTPEQVAEAVGVVAGRLDVEVSGRVTLDNVAAYAAAGPDFVSVGALTHSAPALDVSLEVSS